MNKIVQNPGENRNEMGLHTGTNIFRGAVVKYYIHLLKPDSSEFQQGVIELRINCISSVKG